MTDGAIAVCAPLGAVCRVLADTGLALGAHWFLFVLFAVLVLTMTGRFGRAMGVHNIFNDDARLRVYEADPARARVYLNSPSLLASAGAVLYLVFAWSFAYVLGADDGQRGAMAAFLPTAAVQAAVSSLIVLAAGTVWRGEALAALDAVARWRCLGGVAVGLVVGAVALAVASLIARGLAATGIADWLAMLLGLAVLAAGLVAVALVYRRLISAISLISVLGLLALGYALLSALPDWGQPLVFVALGFGLVATNGGRARARAKAALKLRLPGVSGPDGANPYEPGGELDLAQFYDTQAGLRDAEAEARRTGAPPPRDRLTPRDTLDAWLRHARVAQDTQRPKMVLVTTSGGAYRAAFWTAMVLDRLAARADAGVLTGFAQAVRLITGASGGMIGGAYFAAAATDPAVGPATGAAERAGPGGGGMVARIEADILGVQGDRAYPYFTALPIPRDSLSAVAQQLVQRDLPGLLSSRVQPIDRGTVLEDQWATLDVAFDQLRAGEAAGWRPSLILSPMLAETGQPLLISNLDMFDVLEDRLRSGAGGTKNEVVQFFDMFPASRATFRLKTAVRLNAAFPYISPDTALPTRPYRRVLDAGYYDNYGVDLAAAVLGDPVVRAWVVEHCSGVAVVQIRAFRPPHAEAPDPGPWARAFQWLTTPIEGTLRARSATQLFRNRQTLHQVIKGYPEGFARTVAFELDTDTSLNWYLPDGELAEMRAQIDPEWAVRGLEPRALARAEANQRSLDDLEAFWPPAAAQVGAESQAQA